MRVAYRIQTSECSTDAETDQIQSLQDFTDFAIIEMYTKAKQTLRRSEELEAFLNDAFIFLVYASFNINATLLTATITKNSCSPVGTD